MPDYLGDSTSKMFSHGEFLDTINSFGVLKRFTCFFDSANFLVTGYHLLDDNIHAVFENTEGDTLQFTNLLCGYSGHGPSDTVDALVCLGIPEKEAVEHCCIPDNRGVQIFFAATDTPGRYEIKSATHYYWFEQFENTALKQHIKLQNVSISIVKRTVTFIRPEEFDFIGLLRCLELCDPFSFEYSLDRHSPIKSMQELIDTGALHYAGTLPPGRNCNANLLIRGEQFTIYCCISDPALIGVLNALYYTLTGKNLFTYHNYKGLVFLTDADLPIVPHSLATVVYTLLKHQSVKNKKRLPIKNPRLGREAVHLWKQL